MTPSAFALLPPLPSPDEVRAWDRGAVDLGLAGDILMENAARAAFDVLRASAPRLAGIKVWLLMGGGNNGGDAACLARHLLDAGADPLVLHTHPLRSYKGECRRPHRRSACRKADPTSWWMVCWARAFTVPCDRTCWR